MYDDVLHQKLFIQEKGGTNKSGLQINDDNRSDVSNV